jgi:DNA replication protein DnaC
MTTSAEDVRDNRLVTGLEAFSIGPEPAWLTCSCGVQCARVPCFDCTVAAERRADRARAIAEGMTTIPREFHWATISAAELSSRVDSRRRPIGEVIERILGAHRVVLAGGSGAGKTSLAVACLRERLEHGARFVSAMELATARIQHAAGDGEADVVERSMRASLLLIDDLGEEQQTSAVRDVIRARHAASRPTWVTTGLRRGEIVAKYGDGIRRRLFDGAYAEWFGPMPTDPPPKGQTR